jgi:hypothetical protein
MEKEAKSWETLVSGASDADVSVWWLTLVRALLRRRRRTRWC